MSGNCIDDAANRVAAIEKRGRTFNDLNSFNSQNINRLGVIARLETKSADAIAVLQHEHTIAIKTSNHRSRGSRSKTAFGDSEFTVKRFTE